MGQIRIFNRPPKAFEFDKEDLVIDNVRGDVYYKDDKNRLQKIIKSNDTSTSLSIANLIATTAISSSAITSSAILTGNITASGNISSSGTIFADNFQSSGQQQITVADSFNITGSITSSGDISASGDVYGDQMRASTAYRLEDSGGTSRHIIRSQNNEIEVGNSNFTDGILLTGNTTASGNISASGTIIGSNLSGTNTGDQSLDHLAITGSNVIFGNITSSGNISSSQASTISGGTGSFRRLLLGDTNVTTLSAELHIRNQGSVNINLDSFDQNGNQIINFLNNQEPDFSIGNYFSDGGFQIRSDQKRFAKFGADDGDIIELSGSLHVTGSNGHIITDGNISASGYISSSEINVGGGTFTSASLAAAQASGDNLGNHTATQNLNLGNFDITSSKNIIGITGSFNQTVITLKAGAQDSPFLIKIADSNGQDNKLEMTKDGILKFGALDTLPTAITGGLAYSASAFYAGL